jgi:formiminotetrahydrofolate cyclodeaminase
MSVLADLSLGDIVARVASTDRTPGAGPSAAWACALAAGLVEMVSGVELDGEPADRDAARRRRDRAAALRSEALALADRDVAVYSEVVAIRGHGGEPGDDDRLRAALSVAAEPPVAIVEAAAELTRMAADAVREAHGSIRGEAFAAVTLAEATVRMAVPLVDFNLGGAPDDPRLARVHELAEGARADLERALAG